MLDLFHNHGINVTIIAQVMSALYLVHITHIMQYSAWKRELFQRFTFNCSLVNV